MKNLKLNDLKKTAKELNTFLGLKPAMDIKLGMDELLPKVIEASLMLETDEESGVEEITQLSDVSQTVIAIINTPEEEEVVEEEAKPTRAKSSTAKKEEIVEDDLNADVEACDNIEELKEMIKTNDAFAGIRKGLALQKNVEKLKTRMFTALSEETSAPKPAATAKPKDTIPSVKKSSTKERIAFIAPIIKKAKNTKKECLEMLCEQFPEATRAAHQTILTDGKNPKYNKFDNLLEEDAKGILKFKK